MAYIAATAGATAATMHSTSYRVKFLGKEFLELGEIAKPNIIYHRRGMHFLAYDGFVMYTFEAEKSDSFQFESEIQDLMKYLR